MSENSKVTFPDTLLHGKSITPDMHDVWLADRSKRIGASEASVAIGLPGFQSQLQLYLRKSGQLPDAAVEPDRDSQRRMDWGIRHEPTIAQAYLDEIGGQFLVEQLYCVSSTHPFMCATLDRVHSSGRVLEIKTTGERQANEWGEPGTDEVPYRVLVQVLHQLHCAQIDTADIAVLIGGNDMRIYSVDKGHNQKSLDRIIELEDKFIRAVHAGKPPAIDPDMDAWLLSYLWPDETEGPPVPLTDRESMAWTVYEDTGAQIKGLEKEREQARLVVAEAMKNATRATLIDGRILTRKVVSIEEACITRKAYIYPMFRIAKPRKK